MTIYCRCDAPDYTEGAPICRRCGLPVVDDLPAGGSRACVVCDGRGCEFCPNVRDNDDVEARRQEKIDELAGRGGGPAWNDEAGAVNVRLLCGVAAVAALVLVVWLAWPYLVGAAVTFAGYRVVTRGTRRRRSRASWSSWGRTVAAMYSAWNTRGLVRRDGRVLRVSVPAAAGRAHRDEYGDVPF